MKDFYSMDNYAEKAVLASLLVDNSSWDEVGDSLQPSDFELSFHADVYRAIGELISHGKIADMICVSEKLAGGDNQQGSKTLVDLCEIMERQFSPANIKYYVDIMKTQSSDRKMVAAAQDVIVSVNDKRENRLDHAQQSFAAIADQTSTGALQATDILKDVLIQIDERCRNQSEITGVSTGLVDLNKVTHGLHKGDLIIIAGRPSMGKTLLAMNIAEHVAIAEKKPVVIFSLEMSKEQILERSLASIAKIESDLIRTGKLVEVDFAKISLATEKLSSAKLFIDDTALLTVSDIRAKCRRIKRNNDLSLIIVDYLTLMSGEGENETLRIGNISRGLKLLARDLNVPVIAISQLNRSVEQRTNKRPCMADLRQSGAIEQDADLILFIYRDEVYEATSQNKGVAEIIIAKHRNGAIGTVNLSFNNRYCRFEDYCGTYIPNNKPDPTWKGKQLDY